MKVTIDEEQRAQIHAGLDLQLDRLKKIKKGMEDATTFSSNSLREVQDQIDVIKGVDDDPGLLSIFSNPGRADEHRHAKPGTLDLFEGKDRSTRARERHDEAVEELRNNPEKQEADDIAGSIDARFHAEEGGLTIDQITRGLQLGPWRDSWETENAGEGEPELIRHVAVKPATDTDAETTDPISLRSEAEARARAAWLNLRDAGEVTAYEPPPVDISEVEIPAGDDDGREGFRPVEGEGEPATDGTSIDEIAGAVEAGNDDDYVIVDDAETGDPLTADEAEPVARENSEGASHLALVDANTPDEPDPYAEPPKRRSRKKSE